MKIFKFIFSVVLSGALLFSCQKVDNRNNGVPDDNTIATPHVSQSLINFCDSIIVRQKESGTRNKVFVVAHRANTYEGVFSGIPDNSIPNIEMAIKKGADMVELDVRETSDGVLILMHNSTIDETTTGTGTVEQMTYAQILQYDMRRESTAYKDKDGKTFKVPTLAEALLACKDKIYVNLDLGGRSYSVAKIVKTIRDCEMQNQVMIFVSGTVAKEFQYRDATIAVHPFVSKVSDFAQYTSLPGAKILQYSNVKYLKDDTDFGRKIRSAGFLSYSNLLEVYDFNMKNGDYSALDAFIASESDFVQTDYCELVIDYLKKNSLR